MAGTIRRAFLLVLLLLPGFFAPTPAYAGPDTAPEGMLGVRLLDVPTARTDDPRARTYIVDHLAPGTTIRRRIEISNTTPVPAVVAVYEAAASINDGVFTPAAGRDGNDLTQWTSVDETSLELPSNHARAVAVTITVPPDAAAGERYGVVWAEVRSTSPGTVTVVNRVGIRVYLSVGAGGEPASAMHVDSLTAGRSQDGRPTVTAQVSNTGARALDIAGRLTLTAGPGGLSGGPYDTEKALTLRPGQNGTINFVLSAGLPDGPWTAHLDATSGTTKALQDSTITFPSSALLPSATEPSPDFTPWLPYALLTAVIILVGILVLTRAARRNTKA
ncbi:hypothetical protein AB0284_17810 [Pseudarthrobacter phenanthrenivorans]|uniref:hypothetical protein n=1 Tax=Pseudarthrobacter phenanthrenivorans TaxID=361575 RepID=UPI00344E4DCF